MALCSGAGVSLWFGSHVCNIECDGPEGCMAPRREPKRKQRVSQARAICEECPVRMECLEYAVDNNERFGIWGGLTQRERTNSKLVGDTLARLKQARHKEK